MWFVSVSSEKGWEGNGGGHWLWGGESQVFLVIFGREKLILLQISVLLQNQGKEWRANVE